MNSYYFWFFLFSIVLYFYVTDFSIARGINLACKLVQFECQKTKWWILHNPANPIVKYLMWRRAYKIAKSIQDDLKSNVK